MTDHPILDACTSYAVCGILYNMAADINWASLGATVLLVARLLKDVPEAIGSLHKYITGRKHDKSDR